MAIVDRPSAASIAPRVDPTRAALLLLGLCVIAFAAAQFDLRSRNGFWIDEYFSLWASDPALPLNQLLTDRILPDTNPPLYFTLLALVRHLIEEPRTAFLALNVAAIALTLSFVFIRARATDTPRLTLLSGALFVISGAVVYYAPEGRAYLFGLCAAFAIAWSSVLALEKGAQPGDLTRFAVLGVLAALSHVFAALFAGAFAAALAIEAMWKRRIDVLRLALALGVSATAVFGVWLIFALPNMSNVGWIEFTAASVREALWFVRELTFGHSVIALGLVAFFAWAARRREMWPHARVFALGMMLFAILPVLASFFTPLITGRYWLIGAPAIVVFAALAIRSELRAGAEGGAGARQAQGVAALGLALMLAASAFGFANAQAFTAGKPVWRGAEIVRPLLAGCAPGSVHVWDNHLYATASGAPEATFVDAGQSGTGMLTPGACPILGWAEHVRRGDDFLQTASDADLLVMLKIAAAPEDVRIVRHSSGFVVLRAGEAGDAR